MKTTRYFDAVRSRPDRIFIKDEWIIGVLANPLRTQIQSDGKLDSGEESWKLRVDIFV